MSVTQRRRRSRGRPEVPVRHWSGWWIGGPLIVLILLVSGILLLIHRNGETASESGSSGSRSPTVSVQPTEWIGPLPAEAARLFVEAKVHQQRLKLIADPARDGDLMERFFREGAGVREKVVGIEPLGPVSTGSVTFERFQVKLETGGSRLLCVFLTGNVGKIDFRSYARHGSETWPDLLGGKATEAEEVRVFIIPGSAYLRGFSDERLWSSYLATSPDLDDPVYLYAKRDSATESDLARIIAGSPVRVTLAIRGEGNSPSDRQFEITKFHAAGWVQCPPVPGDE